MTVLVNVSEYSLYKPTAWVQINQDLWFNASIHQDTFSNIQINYFNAKGDSLSSEVIPLPGHQQPNGVIHAKDGQIVIYGVENPSPHATNDTLGPSKAFLYQIGKNSGRIQTVPQSGPPGTVHRRGSNLDSARNHPRDLVCTGYARFNLPTERHSHNHPLVRLQCRHLLLPDFDANCKCADWFFHHSMMEDNPHNRQERLFWKCQV